MDTLTKTKVSTKTMAMAAIGAAGLVAAAAIGYSYTSTSATSTTCRVTVMKAPDSPSGNLLPRVEQVVEKVLVGVPSTCANQTLALVGFTATSTISTGTTSTMKVYKGSVSAANRIGSKTAPSGTGWGSALFTSIPSTLSSFKSGTTSTLIFTADLTHARYNNTMHAKLDSLKFSNSGTNVYTLPVFGNVLIRR